MLSDTYHIPLECISYIVVSFIISLLPQSFSVIIVLRDDLTWFYVYSV